jgi:nucleotide-binding universal stress UspA family protein
MLRRLLVALDATARDAQSLAASRDLARHLHAGIRLLQVEPGAAGSRAWREANQHLHALTEHLRAEGFDAAYVLDFGSPAPCVAQTAMDEHADLIVVAPHHRSFLAALRDLSVTRTLLGRTPAPLLIVPEPVPGEHLPGLLERPDALVMVPVDGSALAEQAVPVGIQFARAYARPLVLVRVVPTLALSGTSAEALEIDQRMGQREVATALHYLAALRQRVSLETPAVSVRTMILRGYPVTCLLQLGEVHPASLMVLSTRGHSGLARLFLGSVSADLARRTTVPLVVVPPLVREHAVRDVPAPAGRVVPSLA